MRVTGQGAGLFLVLCVSGLSGCLTPASCHTSYGSHLYSSGRFPVQPAGLGVVEACPSDHDSHLLALSAGHGASYLRFTVLPWQFCCGAHDFCLAAIHTAGGCFTTGISETGATVRSVVGWRSDSYSVPEEDAALAEGPESDVEQAPHFVARPKQLD